MERSLKTATTNLIWHGTRLRRALAAADPDRPPRMVALPATWEDGAAAALAALVPGGGPVALAAAATDWIAPIAARAQRAGAAEDLAARLHGLLLARRGAPGAAVWRGEVGTEARFVLNLAAFYDAQTGFDRDGFAHAVATATVALACLDSAATRLAVGVADLAGLLATLGLDYASDAARDRAAAIAALLRETVQRTVATLPGRVRVLTAIAAPDAAEALLGVETGGIAPAFSPLSDAGVLTRTAQAWLAARAVTAEAALAATLAGTSPFPHADTAAHQAMRATLAPLFDVMPPLPVPLAAPAATPNRRELPARHASLTQRAVVGGHRVFLRTGEYADGTPGDIAISLPKDSAAMRGLTDAFAQAVSLGLQHGVPLADFVDAFTLTRFGAAGVVEGDPAVTRATSVLDYVFRSLAARYLGGTPLPEAEPDEAEPPPMLPLELPEAGRRGLRIVK
jgi:hypothetical protein